MVAAAGNIYSGLYPVFNPLFSFLLNFSCFPCSVLTLFSFLASFPGPRPLITLTFYSFLSAPYSLSLLFIFPFFFSF